MHQSWDPYSDDLRHQKWSYCVLWVAVLGAGLVARSGHGAVAADQLSAALETIRSVEREGDGNVPASIAWQTVSQADLQQLPIILAAMKDAGPIPTNYLRAAIDTIVQRERGTGGGLSMDMLRAFYEDKTNAPAARRTAYELMQTIDPAVADEIIPNALNDSSLEMRYDAVARVLEEAEQLQGSGDKDGAVDAFRRAFDAARDLDQVQQAAKELRELGQEVDLPKHFGFIMQWHVMGPFDNTGTRGFDTAYPPEMAIDLAGEHDGKSGPVRWNTFATEDELGVVDLNVAVGPHKGAIAYAYAEFESPVARDVEIRLGSISANKTWVNGELVTANHVYHTGMEVDQYRGTARLRPGTNAILVKIAQNEQTETWAVDWKFQLRVCDSLGTAIISGGKANALQRDPQQ